MSKSDYYLVVQNKRKFKIIKMEELGFFKTKKRLEEIDCFTLMFNTLEDMNLYLFKKGLINSINNDIFIIKRYGDNIIYLEPIYNSKLNIQMEEINKYKRNNWEIPRSDSYYIINKFICRMYYDEEFYNSVISGKTNIYKSFYSLFDYTPTSIESYKEIVDDCKWSNKSYYLIRNIYEALNRHINYLYENNRRNIINNLYEVTDKNYEDGQLRLFDYKDLINNQNKESDKIYEKKRIK